MRPLPRLFAVTTDSICRAADFGVRAAAVAAAGPAAAILVRAPDSTTAQLAAERWGRTSSTYPWHVTPGTRVKRRRCSGVFEPTRWSVASGSSDRTSGQISASRCSTASLFGNV